MLVTNIRWCYFVATCNDATRRAELCRLVLTLKDHPSAAGCFKAFQLVARNGQRILRTGRLVKGPSYRGELAENE